MTMESRKEKVLEIADRAGFVVNIGGHDDRNADLHYKLDRFAELIVRECIDVCANGWQGEFTAAGISQCVSDLKEHFGVE